MKRAIEFGLMPAGLTWLFLGIVTGFQPLKFLAYSVFIAVAIAVYLPELIERTSLVLAKRDLEREE